MCTLIWGCSVGPPYVPPYTDVPSRWKNESDSKCISIEQNKDGEPIYLDDWWQVFEDEKLNELESLALTNNRDLYVAYERIQQYRALMGIAASYFYPQFNLNPLYSNIGELIKIYASGSNLINNTALKINNPALKTVFRAHELLYYLPINLSYEVDLWGQIKDQYNYAKYNWLAEQKDYEVVMLALTSTLATAYYQLRAADEQIGLLAKVLNSRQKAYQINKDRYETEVIFYADVALAAEEVDSTLTRYEEVIRQRSVLENQIAVLIGYPASEFRLNFSPLTGLPPLIPEGLPSELLLRRPDVAKAEYEVRAAHAMVKEAYSQFFPSLTLTGTGGFESPVLKGFLKWISRYWMEGAQINQLIFDGFKTPYNLKSQIAQFQQAGGVYQQVILEAMQEVEDSLKDLYSYGKEYRSMEATTQWAQKAYELYSDRYMMGVINYLDVVNTERDWLNFQIDLAALQGYRYLATIQLIKALGGGWSIPPSAQVQDQCL